MEYLRPNNTQNTYKAALNDIKSNHPDLLDDAINNIVRAFRFTLKKVELFFRYLSSTISNTDNSQEKTLAERILLIKVNSTIDMKGNDWLALGDNKNFRGHRSNIKQMLTTYPKAVAAISAFNIDATRDHHTFHTIENLKKHEKERCMLFETHNNLAEKEDLYHNIKQAEEVHNIVDTLFIELIQNDNFKPNSNMQLIMEMPDFGYTYFDNSSNLSSKSVIKEYNLACQSWMTALKNMYKVKITLLPFLNNNFNQEYIDNNTTYDAFNLEYTATNELNRAKKIEEYITSRVNPLIQQQQESSRKTDHFYFNSKTHLCLEHTAINPDTNTETNNNLNNTAEAKEPVAANIENKNFAETTDDLVSMVMEKVDKVYSPDEFISSIDTDLNSNPHIDGITTSNNSTTTDNTKLNVNLTTSVVFTDAIATTQDSSTMQNVSLGDLRQILYNGDFINNTDSKVTQQQGINQPDSISYNLNFNLIDKLPENEDGDDQAFLVLLYAKTQAEILKHQNITVDYDTLKNKAEEGQYNLTAEQPPVMEALADFDDQKAKTAKAIDEEHKNNAILKTILYNVDDHELDNNAEDQKLAFGNKTINDELTEFRSTIILSTNSPKPKLSNKATKNATTTTEIVDAQVIVRNTDLTSESSELQTKNNEKLTVNSHININIFFPKEFKDTLENTSYQPLANMIERHGAEKVLLAAMNVNLSRADDF